MTGEPKLVEAYSRGLLRQAGWGTAIVLVGGLWLWLDLASRPATSSGMAQSFTIAALAFGLAALCLCAWLGFDALLFRLIASYDDPAKGCRAVDEVLSRMRLKASPDRTRDVAERIAGMGRIVLRQRILMAAFCVATLLTLLARPA